MEGRTFIIRNEWQRRRAIEAIANAPLGTVITAKANLRSIPQNAKLWAVLDELAAAKPDGRVHPVHVWKALAMDLAGCIPQWERTLNGDGIVCVGYKSSRLTKPEMSDVIEAIHAYGAEHGVEFAE